MTSCDAPMAAVNPSEVRHEVENRLYEYAAFADELDYEGIAHLLRHATLSSHGGVDLTGERAIAEHLKVLFATVGPSRHMMANVRLEVAQDGSAAAAQVLYNKWVVRSEPVVDAVGRYASTFAPVDGRWEFTSHRVLSQWRRPAGDR